MLTKRMPGGASSCEEEEAPAVYCSDGITCSRGHTSPSSSPSEVVEEEQSTEEQDLIVAVGNAAKAARRVGIRTLQQTTAKETTTDIDDDVDVCNTNPTSTNTTNEKKNETCTWNCSSNADATTTSTTTAHVVVDDEDDYVVGNYGEEEVRAYKTSGAATLSQSEHIIQQQQQQQQGINALISNVGLFLDQTWNWLHYFLVTIIFLNIIHFADRRESVVGEANSVEVEGAANKEENNIQVENNNSEQEVVGDELVNKNFSLESEESGKIVNNTELNCTSVENNSALLENSKSSEITMSPNTCSIQNQQEVENGEEAIMAVVATEEKAEAAAVVVVVAAATAATTTTSPVVVVEPKSEENNEEKQQQITIIFPSAEQVVVVSGDDSDDNSDKDALGGIRRDSVDSYTSSEGSGNLGDTEGDNGGKSSASDDGTSSIEAGADADDEKQVAQRIISQVESMFSDDHLAKDGFLLKHVRRRSDGFVSLKLVAGLRKVKQISRDFPVVLNALKDSSRLEINSEGTKVRRMEPLTSFLKSVPIKSKDKEKEGSSSGKDGSGNDENQHPAASIQENIQSPSKSGNNENGNNRQGGANHQNNQSRRYSNANNTNGNQSRRNSNAHGKNNNHRKSSNTSTASSNNSSRHNSFSKAPGVPPPSGQQHPADLFRNVYTSSLMTAYSSGEESPQVGRRRGGSLPIAALQRASNGAYLSPNSSPPNGTLILGPNGARPKSNSYCEGASPTTMSPWLQRRKASASSRLSSGELTFSGVTRQPRGPDGTKGFATGYRAMILEERLEQQQNSAVSA